LTGPYAADVAAGAVGLLAGVVVVLGVDEDVSLLLAPESDDSDLLAEDDEVEGSLGRLSFR
jgi:hypothetical protein